MINGFCGRLLRINLSSLESREEEIPDAVSLTSSALILASSDKPK